MDEFSVQIVRSAENDLRDIRDYISSQLNAPVTALNMSRTITDAIAKLKTTALAHPLVRDDRLAAIGYRPLIIKNYIAFYIVNEKERIAFVERILYARRDWMSIL